MGKQPGKLKRWFEERKDGLIRGACVFGACLATAFITNKVSTVRCAISLKDMHDEGIIKFFNPSTGLEVNVTEACEVVKAMNNK